MDGAVNALWPGPDGNSVYIGGKINNVNGVISRKIALLNLSTGQAVAGFKVPLINGPVNDFAISAGRLFIGGQFTKVNGVARGGLATVTPATGALDPYMNVQLTEHHNWNGTGAYALVGAFKFDLTADGRRMIVVGNFKRANGTDRDQIVMLDLGAASATIANWHTDRFKAACWANMFDAYVRDVGFSPDGTYFAVVAAGVVGDLCDATTRWENTSGTSLHPTWVNATGGDSLWSVAVTGAAIYIGGHHGWVNNSNTTNLAEHGAVPRPGISALDPVNGLPLTWNPGRNPRGAGTFALYATAAGLWVGSDTNYFGNFQYYRGKVASSPSPAARSRHQ